MIDPERLVSSARKVFGQHFDAMWGEVVPVPDANIRTLKGGESDGPWRVQYTPGHAKHHVCYFHEPSRTAFTGDVTGVRINGGPAFLPHPRPTSTRHSGTSRSRSCEPGSPNALPFSISDRQPTSSIRSKACTNPSTSLQPGPGKPMPGALRPGSASGYRGRSMTKRWTPIGGPGPSKECGRGSTGTGRSRKRARSLRRFRTRREKAR